MRNVACLGVVALGLFTAIASASCSSKEEGTPARDAGKSETSNGDGTDDAWVIGVSDSLTGGIAGIGTPIQNAVRVAEAYVNSKGGILGKKVKFVVEDDTSDEGDIAKGTITKLLGEGAGAIIGPNGSGQVSAVQQLLY